MSQKGNLRESTAAAAKEEEQYFLFMRATRYADPCFGPVFCVFRASSSVLLHIQLQSTGKYLHFYWLSIESEVYMRGSSISHVF